ncbi:MAG: ABC transporter permease subunit [Planctomycetes bacterium]|nr:ABC transporter permease subunit [Planctomycetota bacterium]
MKWLLLCLLFPTALLAQEPELVVGSKAFNEGVILGEIVTQTMRESGARVEHKSGMGGTGVVWSALKNGEIDVYVEYTGTLLGEIYASEQDDIGPRDLPDLLKRDGVQIVARLGFQNTYAIGMKRSLAAELGIHTLRDLAKFPELKLGFSNEFKERADGWPGLKEAYAMEHRDVAGLDHSLAYAALEDRKIDVTDLYSTDAEIEQYDLVILTDDNQFFPEYEAVILARIDLNERAPDAFSALSELEGAISEQDMVTMNAGVKLDKRMEADVAQEFLKLRREAVAAGQKARAMERQGRASLDQHSKQMLSDMARMTGEHLVLVFLSLFAATFVAIPLGVMAQRRRRFGQWILGGAGVLQTIPSIAMLVLLIPFVGIGWGPAVIALFLYSLLPIIRNTHAGLNNIDPMLIESADALGLPRGARMRLIELPLAARTILAGIKTAAVINVGTATLGGFIGAGGYGEAIFAGIRRQDDLQILSGAVPAALMALALQGLFELAERFVVPRGLRLSAPA